MPHSEFQELGQEWRMAGGKGGETAVLLMGNACRTYKNQCCCLPFSLTAEARQTIHPCWKFGGCEGGLESSCAEPYDGGGGAYVCQDRGQWAKKQDSMPLLWRDILSCMVRAEAYTAAHGYSSDPRTLRAEDYDLWFRLYELGYQGYNLQTPLYKMRDDENAYQRRKFKYCLNEAYVRVTGFHRLKIPTTKYVWVLRPIVVGLLPKCLYFELHRKKKLLLQRTSTIC